MKRLLHNASNLGAVHNIQGNQAARTLHLREPMEEHDILSLQEAFLRPGIYHAYSASLAEADRVIATVLTSLKYHRDIAYLSTIDHAAGMPHIRDLFRELNGKPEFALEQYFIDTFYFDFLWIMESTELTSSILYRRFKAMMHSFNIPSMIPVVLVKKS